MGHWTNSEQQTLSAASGEITVIDFDTEIIPGSLTALQDGVYDYAYHINLLKPSGEIGPSRVTSVLAVRRLDKTTDLIRESRSFVDLDTGSEEALSHTGQTPLSSGDRAFVRVNLDDITQSGQLMTRVKQGQASLSFGLVGASASGNFAGSTFPTMGMGSGHPFYRTDLNEPFNFTGSKWLGLLRADGAGRTGNQTGDTYLRRYNGQIMSASRGIYMPFDANISCLSWTKGAATVGNIEIHRDGVSIASINADAAAGGVDLDVDFDTDGILALFWSSANTTNNIQVSVHYRRRG